MERGVMKKPSHWLAAAIVLASLQSRATVVAGEQPGSLPSMAVKDASTLPAPENASLAPCQSCKKGPLSSWHWPEWRPGAHLNASPRAHRLCDWLLFQHECACE